MRRVTLLIDGILISVFTFADTIDDIKGIADDIIDGGLAVIIYPMLGSDFRVVCFDKSLAEPGEPYLAFMAVSYLFGAIRGLPSVGFDLEYHGKVYKDIACSDTPNFLINIEKCKLICAKTIKFDDGVEVNTDIIKGDTYYICTACNDVDMFDTHRLKSLGGMSDTRFFAPSLAISYDGTLRVKTSLGVMFYDAIAIGITALKRRGIVLPLGKATAFVNGVPHSYSLSVDTLTFYPNIKYLS